MGLLAFFAPQQAYPKVFLAGEVTGLEPPLPLAGYLPRVIDYCLRTRWGRNEDTPRAEAEAAL